MTGASGEGPPSCDGHQTGATRKRVVLKTKAKWIRSLTIVACILVIFVTAACKLGFGTVCSLGLPYLSYVCPLGFLEAALASRSLLPQVWLGIALVLVLVVLLGRFFCAWICPMALLRQVFGVKDVRRAKPIRAVESLKRMLPRPSVSSTATGPAARSGASTPPNNVRYALLAGVLVSSFIFGFPVFCLVCPVGLFFGALFAVSRLLSLQQPSLELLILPALLCVELFAFKSWCRSICPLGALFSLAGTLNRFFRPTVNADACLTGRGYKCQACKTVCPAGINLLDQNKVLALASCTKCRECSDRCPVKAIRFPFRAR